MTSTNYQAPIALKLLLIGSSSVGKSSLLLRFTDHLFMASEETQATIGVDYKVKMITKGDKKFKLSIWDTAGQERFRTLTSSYYRSCQGVLIVYSIDQRDTFDALQTWFTELETYASPEVIKIVVGNKTDKSSSRVVSYEEGELLASQKGCLFFEASAKSESSVEEIFETLVDQIITKPELYTTTTAQKIPGAYNVSLGTQQEDQSGYCAC